MKQPPVTPPLPINVLQAIYEGHHKAQEEKNQWLAENLPYPANPFIKTICQSLLGMN